MAERGRVERATAAGRKSLELDPRTEDAKRAPKLPAAQANCGADR